MAKLSRILPLLFGFVTPGMAAPSPNESHDSLEATLAGLTLREFRLFRAGLELKHAKAGVSGAGSGGTGVPPSEPPGYATHGGPKPNAKLQ
jgi:hypothetical protein